MATKYISSTQAQNNFGQVLDDVTRMGTRYIVKRRGRPEAVVLSFDDFMHVLEHESDRAQLNRLLKEVQPTYTLGEPVE